MFCLLIGLSRWRKHSKEHVLCYTEAGSPAAALLELGPIAHLQSRLFVCRHVCFYARGTSFFSWGQDVCVCDCVCVCLFVYEAVSVMLN